mmetsp:Transcript_49169/g.107182  ORF Transcript_49169/g.107182 Transcript_49169/m.107182 type:complete len:177 (+) Transcript_49169:99-629(+)
MYMLVPLTVLAVLEPLSDFQCDLKSLQLRSKNGDDIQFSKTTEGDTTTVTGVMCHNVETVKPIVRMAEPLFGSDHKCEAEGVPGKAKHVAEGERVEFTITVVNGTATTHTYDFKISRQSSSDDAESCKVTRAKSAAQDCGYAPMIEKRRQQAATDPNKIKELVKKQLKAAAAAGDE